MMKIDAVDAAEICVRCGSCLKACHMFLTSGKTQHAAALKIRKLRKLRLDVNLEHDYHDYYDYAFECSGCRRCAIFCPFSIDTASYVSKARGQLTSTGKCPESLHELAETQVMKGERWQSHIKTFRLGIEMLEKQYNVRIPVEEKADILYVALQGAHTIAPAAKIFNAVDENWTLSIFEASNFAFFLGDMERARQIAGRVRDEAERVEAREIVITECGHAYRVFKLLFPKWFGKDFRIRNVVEVVADYLKRSEIELKSTIKTPLTYHDPCQAARNGGLIEEPRFVLSQTAEDFREMIPNKEFNFCCGGGGGLVAVPELSEVRLRAGEVKVRQIRETGAKLVSTICENCKTQLKDLREYYRMSYEIAGVIDLVAQCMG
jgi:Fe-S oxidoreductase